MDAEYAAIRDILRSFGLLQTDTALLHTPVCSRGRELPEHQPGRSTGGVAVVVVVVAVNALP